jgi:hypothetical protein
MAFVFLSNPPDHFEFQMCHVNRDLAVKYVIEHTHNMALYLLRSPSKKTGTELSAQDV